MRPPFRTYFLFLAFFVALTACGERKLVETNEVAKSSRNITVKGSDTMVVLGQRWAETYMKGRPTVTIQVTGGGSGTGIAALLNGTTDIANLSRLAKKEEKEQALQQGKPLQEFPVAFDGLAVAVNQQNPIQELTLDQLKGIYTGRISNWKELGGPDQRILRYCREANSGTYVFFKEHILAEKDYAPDCQTMAGTGAVAEAVARDPSGIGYGGVSYFEKRAQLKILALKKDSASPAISPLLPDGKTNNVQIRNLEYPISRLLYVYVGGAARPEVKDYVDWMLSPPGQNIVAEVGYVSLR